MTIRSQEIAVTVAGSAGSATGSTTGDHPVSGRILAIYIDYTSQPGTCDVSVTSDNQTFLTITNGNTDGWFYPRAAIVDTGGSVIATEHIEMPCNDYITVTVAQGDPGSVDVKILSET